MYADDFNYDFAVTLPIFAGRFHGLSRFAGHKLEIDRLRFSEKGADEW